MEATEPVTITLPETVVREIDLRESDRGRFVREAIEHELDRRRREALRESVENPHMDGLQLAEVGFDDWASRLPDSAALVDASAGRPVRWVHGDGWTETERTRPRVLRARRSRAISGQAEGAPRLRTDS